MKNTNIYNKKSLSNYPNLMREWHPNKNVLSPETLTIGSNKKVWWFLPYDDPRTGKHFDFEWEASVKDRVKNQGCPYLSGKKVWPGFNDLATLFPNLAKEWNYNKNEETPDQVTVGSEKKVWWFLPYDDPRTGKHFDFEWEAAINSRVKGNNCPYFNNSKVWPGFNDLSSTYPQIAKEWNYKKNGELTPEKIVYGSSKKVWWFLPYDDPRTGKHFDFEWEACVYLRSLGKQGCPYLSGKKVWVGFNDLASLFPDIAKEWHPLKNKPLTPSDVTSKSGKKVWWFLPYDDPRTGKHFDFEWEDRIADRTNGNGCPYISSHKVWPGYNDLSTYFPELAKEWHPHKNTLKPSETMCYSNKKVWWFLPYDDPRTGKHFDFEWEDYISNRVKGIGCPFLSNSRVWEGFNDLATVLPALAEEWNYKKNKTLLPTQFTAGSSKSVWWSCPNCGNEWKSIIYSRMRGRGCSKCSIEMNTSFPEAAIYYYLKKGNPNTLWRYIESGVELDIYMPDRKIAIEYDGKYWHKNKREKDIEKNNYCANQGITIIRLREMLYSLDHYSVDIIVKDLKKETLERAIVDLINLLSMDSSIVNLNRDEIDILNLYIKRKKDNSLETLYPELAKEWHPTKNGNITPSMVSVGSQKRVWWFLPYDDPRTGKHFDFEWKSSIKNRIKERNCPYILGKKVYKGFNDLETLLPDLAKEWHPYKNKPLTPSDFTTGSNKMVWWFLPYDDPRTGKHFDFEWEASINNRSKGRACPYLTGRKVLPGFNDFATLHPELLIEWDFDMNKSFNPSNLSEHSNERVSWKCSQCGYTWKASINSRVSQNSGCLKCYHKRRRKRLTE